MKRHSNPIISHYSAHLSGAGVTPPPPRNSSISNRLSLFFNTYGESFGKLHRILLFSLFHPNFKVYNSFLTFRNKAKIPHNLIAIGFGFVITCFSFPNQHGAFAQTLKRQCIASTGNSSPLSFGEGQGVRFQQTIGQPYGTTSYYSNKTRYNPGFQQPIFSVETIKSTINATIFPNPTSNQITIETNLTLENVIIQIIELSGKLVLNEKINEFKSYIINCADWSNGVYLITLSDSKNNLYSSKLIISK